MHDISVPYLLLKIYFNLPYQAILDIELYMLISSNICSHWIL